MGNPTLAPWNQPGLVGKDGVGTPLVDKRSLIMG